MTNIFPAMSDFFSTVIGWSGIKTDRTLRNEFLKSFDKAVLDLSSENPSVQLIAAILLRRFFLLDEMKNGKDFLKTETINVISSLLRTLPTSVFQKTVADGLAYAGDLTNADLQKTNLQDVCLEGKNGRLILNGCDLYMADLSHALIKNVDAVKAYFYHSILANARIKNANLTRADFRNADLTNCVFENVNLYMANFTNAVNIPKEIKKQLIDHLEPDGTISKRYKTIKKVRALGKSVKGSVFFSIPGCVSIEDSSIIAQYKKEITNLGYNVICYTRDKYPQFGQINKIRLDIMKSSAMIVFGLKQLKLDKAIYRPGTEEQNDWSTKWIHTPWNELEVGLGAMIGMPILLVKDKCIDTGIFDRHLSESFIEVVSTSSTMEEVKNSKQFHNWTTRIQNAQFSLLSQNKELAEYLSEKTELKLDDSISVLNHIDNYLSENI